jgi:hypothetical protein
VCFSASASFTAGTLLLGLGAASVKSARRPAELPFAAIPLLFSAQQFTEGVLWLAFQHDRPVLQQATTWLFALFAHVLWPAYMPVAVLQIEPDPRRRRALRAIAALGAGVSTWLLHSMIAGGVVARPVGGHIEYVTVQPHAEVAAALYLVASTLGLLVSSQRAVRALGALALLAFAAVWIAWEAWLVSVWCFCAAALSALVLVQLRWGSGRAAATGLRSAA